MLELSLLTGALLLLVLLAASLWRGSGEPSEFFPSQRQRALNGVRLRCVGLLAVAGLALGLQFMIGQQKQKTIDLQDRKLLQHEAELLRLRVDYELARKSSAAAEAPRPAAAQAAAPEPAQTDDAAAEELAQVSVSRAVVRDRPAGRAQFTLTSGARVHLQGEPADNAGRLWRQALTDDGRSGWIALEVLSAIKG